MTARPRLARWTVPVLLTSSALLLAGCGDRGAEAGPGDGASVAEESPTEEPTPTESSEPSEPTEEPTESPEPAGSLTDALLPGEEVPGFNDEFQWSDGPTQETEPAELAGTCHRFELTSIGAEQVAYRTYDAVQGGDSQASELVAQFPDDETAARAEQVLQSWRKGCAKNLKKFDSVDVGDLTDVPVEGGAGSWYMVSYGPAEDDPEAGYFDAQGIVHVGNRVAVLRMALIGQDYNYTVGEEPMVGAVQAAAARL